MLVPLAVTAVLGTATGEHSQQPDVVFLVERDHAVVEQVSSQQGVATLMDLGERDLDVGIDEPLLVDVTNALDAADVVRVLRAKVTGSMGLDLAVRFLLGLGLLQSYYLRLGEEQSAMRDPGF